MGKRGPAPEPIPLRILKGRGNGKDVAGRPIPKVPAFERCAPEAPAWLDPEALAEWSRIVPALDAVGSIKPEDRGIITARCVAWSRAVHAEAIIAAEGTRWSIRSPAGSPPIPRCISRRPPGVMW